MNRISLFTILWCPLICQGAPNTQCSAAVFHAATAKAPPPHGDGVLIDERNAWVYSEGRLLRTMDAGSTWYDLSPTDMRCFGDLRKMMVRFAFLNASHGWMGTDSAIWETSDGGNSWKRRFVGLWAGFYIRPTHGWLNLAHNDHREYHVSRDGGATWSACANSVPSSAPNPSDVYFLDSNVGFAIMQGTRDEHRVAGVGVTSDGGCTWRQLWADEEGTLRLGAIFMLNKSEGWVGDGYSGGLFHTNDGGRTWEPATSPHKGFAFESIYFNSAKHGWVAGSWAGSQDQDSGIFETRDAGRSWSQISVTDLVASKARSVIPLAWHFGRLLEMQYRAGQKQTK